MINEKQVKYLWDRDNACLMEKPSIDREDNDGNYTLGNCRFIEHFENTGKNRRKPVMQYDLEGNFIKGFNSVKDASRKTKLNYRIISAIASGINKSGYIWKYKNE